MLLFSGAREKFVWGWSDGQQVLLEIEKKCQTN
jgi:hypothetical protein